MGSLRLLPKKMSRFGTNNPCITHQSLPTFYMSDYSVLGVLVNNHHKAGKVLKDNEFSVTEEPENSNVVIDHPAHIQEMVRILTLHGCDPEIADIVDQVYQG